MSPSDKDAAFRRFYREHVAFVVRASRLFGVASPQTEDLAQEVFIAAHRRLDFTSAAGARGWLFRTIHNLARRTRRSEYRLLRRRLAWADVVDARGLDRNFETWDARGTVQALLDNLSEDQRATVIGIELLGMTAAELSESFDVNVNTVYSRLRLARKRLAELSRATPADARMLMARAGDDENPSSRMSSAIWVGVTGRLGLASKLGVTAGTSALAKFAVVTLALVARPFAGDGQRPNADIGGRTAVTFAEPAAPARGEGGDGAQPRPAARPHVATAVRMPSAPTPATARPGTGPAGTHRTNTAATDRSKPTARPLPERSARESQEVVTHADADAPVAGALALRPRTDAHPVQRRRAVRGPAPSMDRVQLAPRPIGPVVPSPSWRDTLPLPARLGVAATAGLQTRPEPANAPRPPRQPGLMIGVPVTLGP